MWQPLRRKIPKVKEQYDHLTLREAHNDQNNIDESIVNLTADAKIHFKHVITTMDAIRYQLEKDSYSDIKAFADASRQYERKVVDGKEVEAAKLLWPDVVFAMAQ